MYTILCTLLIRNKSRINHSSWVVASYISKIILAYKNYTKPCNRRTRRPTELELSLSKINALSSATHNIQHSAKILTTTTSLPSVFYRALGKGFVECPDNPWQNKVFCMVGKWWWSLCRVSGWKDTRQTHSIYRVPEESTRQTHSICRVPEGALAKSPCLSSA